MVLLALAAPLAAHDHWIAPSSFRPAVGERLDVRLCVGHPGEYQEQPRDPRRIVRFERVGADGARPLVGLDGRSPAGFFVTREAEALWLVYQSNHAFVAIEPATYARYLEEEGLADVHAERERRGESALPGRDSYLRCDKAFVRVGGAPAPDFARVFGLPLELVLASDPTAAGEGAELLLRLELAGKPLADRQVKLLHLDAPHTTALARTDAGGTVRFPLRAGRWLASAVHQRRIELGQGPEGDWEGLWASLTFEAGP